MPITHESLGVNLNGLVHTYRLTSKDVAGHLLPFFHVAGITIGLLATLSAGGSVVIAPVFDPLTFPKLIRKHQVTWFTSVPAMFTSILDHKSLFALEVGDFWCFLHHFPIPRYILSVITRVQSSFYDVASRLPFELHPSAAPNNQIYTFMVDMP